MVTVSAFSSDAARAFLSCVQSPKAAGSTEADIGDGKQNGPTPARYADLEIGSGTKMPIMRNTAL